ILLGDGMEAVCALLGITLAGLAYLPLDPHTPGKRVESILKRSRCKLVISDRVLFERICNCAVLLSDTVSESMETAPLLPSCEDIAYVIYTSGSTGVPKGVAVSHKALKNLCAWHIRQYELTEKDVTTRFAGFGFDAAVWEIFPALAVGACIHVIPDGIRLDLKALSKYYEDHGVTVSFLPTPVCEQFLKLPCKSLRILLTGGDKLNYFESLNSYTLYNNYGPTENAVVATSYKVTRSCGNIPIGKPIDNVRAFVMNDRGGLVPPYGKGELCLGGSSLAYGYYLDPEQTAERFVQTPYGRLYRTGDMVRWNKDGVLEFLGRQDQQIKINGNRIELGEIEGALKSLPHITGAVATVTEGEKGRWILAYYTADTEYSEPELKQNLASVLPGYMVPRRILPISELPLTLNGKVDRRALPIVTVETRMEESISVKPTEKQLLEIWKELLGQEQIGLYENFMEIGGNSILVVKMQDLLDKIYPDCVSVSDIFALPTISHLAEHIDRKRGKREELHLKAMSLKKSFMLGKDIGDRGRSSFSEEGNIHKRLLELEGENPGMLQNLLRTAFAATVALLTVDRHWTLYCYEDRQYFALSVKATENFGELLTSVTEAYETAHKIEHPEIIQERQRDGLICAYGFNARDTNELSQNAQLYWHCDLMQNAFKVRIDSQRLPDRVLRSLLDRFYKLLCSVLGA
ncbi:MAG: non-ribosomal peptide synthetase, partial [Oscillospiraceae bacterium]|nr:non-ribosomal peptide synthetase [Oscillospiraceae bacterium]